MTSSLWWLGSLGMIAIEASYVPQLVRLHRIKQADEISLLFPGLNLVGRLLALAYALSSGEAVFTAGLMVGITLRGALLLQVAWYRRREQLLARGAARAAAYAGTIP